MVLDHVRQFDVPDRAGRAADLPATPSLPLAPTELCAGHETLLPVPTQTLPLRRHVAQEIGEDVTGARTVGAVHRDDRHIRQPHAAIEFGDPRIVPAS